MEKPIELLGRSRESVLQCDSALRPESRIERARHQIRRIPRVDVRPRFNGHAIESRLFVRFITSLQIGAWENYEQNL